MWVRVGDENIELAPHLSLMVSMLSWEQSSHQLWKTVIRIQVSEFSSRHVVSCGVTSKVRL